MRNKLFWEEKPCLMKGVRSEGYLPLNRRIMEPVKSIITPVINKCTGVEKGLICCPIKAANAYTLIMSKKVGIRTEILVKFFIAYHSRLMCFE
jgi:hypothetical protein